MSIFKEIESKPFEYVFLAVSLLISAILFFFFSYDPHYQRNVVYGAAGAYFLWSILHHYRRGDLETSIVVEYLILILFGVIILTSTLL